MHVLETSGVIGSKHKLYIEKEIVFYRNVRNNEINGPVLYADASEQCLWKEGRGFRDAHGREVEAPRLPHCEVPSQNHSLGRRSMFVCKTQA